MPEGCLMRLNVNISRAGPNRVSGELEGAWKMASSWFPGPLIDKALVNSCSSRQYHWPVSARTKKSMADSLGLVKSWQISPATLDGRASRLSMTLQLGRLSTIQQTRSPNVADWSWSKWFKENPKRHSRGRFHDIMISRFELNSTS
jgi:hypothetical protein